MFTISEMKAIGKMAFRRNFWMCVLVALVLTLVSSGGGNSNRGRSNHQNQVESSYEVSGQQVANGIQNAAGALQLNIGPVRWLISTIGWGFSVVMALVVGSAALLLSVFIFTPLQVGCRRFFIRNLYTKAQFGEVGFAFKSNLINVAVTMLIMEIKIILWSLLLIVPGIIKAYEYRMVPYILAENPNISGTVAFQESRRMMEGNKMNAFVLDLSFIGWYILSGITLGVAGLFWVNPYKASTDAALYDRLR